MRHPPINRHSVAWVEILAPFDALPLNGDRSRGLNARFNVAPPKRLRCRELRDDVVAERCPHRGFQRSRPDPPSSAQLRWHIG